MKFEPREYPNILSVALLMSLGYQVDELHNMGDTNNAAYVTLYRLGSYSEKFQLHRRETMTVPLFSNNRISSAKYASQTIGILQNELFSNKDKYSDIEKLHYNEILTKFENENFSGNDFEDAINEYVDTVELILFVLNKSGEFNYLMNKGQALRSLRTAVRTYILEAESNQRVQENESKFLAKFNAKYAEEKREEYLKALEYGLEDVLNGTLIRNREQENNKDLTR